MKTSLGEISAEVKKAGRGAGLPWGLANEAGWAAQWLVKNDLPGIQIFCRMFHHYDGFEAWREHSPDPRQPGWNPGKPMCGFLAGLALSDRGWPMHGNSRTLELGPTLFALAIVPFAARIAEDVLSIEWEHNLVFVHKGQFETYGHNGALTKLSDPVRISMDKEPPISGDSFNPDCPNPTSIDAPEKCWSQIQRLAERTYAPETEQSRRKGAGEG